jgi:hypothetical protein
MTAENVRPDPADDELAVSEDTGRSGAHRIQQRAVRDQELPPTPDVLSRRPRITTGSYAVIRPAKATK